MELRQPANTLALRQDATDFMARGYMLIDEPLNLRESGQEWFSKVYRTTSDAAGGSGLVLGATSWMGDLLCGNHSRVFMIDMSAVMLQMAEAGMRQRTPQSPAATFIQANWQELPGFPEPIRVTVGDNSFSFLQYPEAWEEMCDELAGRMAPQGLLITRFLSLPQTHERSATDQIVRSFMLRETMNYTELRAALLFGHCNDRTYAIDTEAVLSEFDANRSLFDALLRKFNTPPQNDLLTINKYRGAGAVYYAPPLPHVLGLLSRRFRVLAVHFGPYAMSEYFPLVVAARR